MQLLSAGSCNSFWALVCSCLLPDDERLHILLMLTIQTDDSETNLPRIIESNLEPTPTLRLCVLLTSDVIWSLCLSVHIQKRIEGASSHDCSPARVSSSAVHIMNLWDCPKYPNGALLTFVSFLGVDQLYKYQMHSPISTQRFKSKVQAIAHEL
jgi:hypothetical protein